MPGPLTAQLGRISGSLLSPNLVRNGVDLSVETDLFYLNVTDDRIGVNTDTPTKDLEVLGTTRTTNQEVTNLADIANIGFNANGTVYSNVGPIIVSPNQSASPYLEFERNITDSLEINDNRISNYLSDPDIATSSIFLQAAGSGSAILDNDTEILGNLNVEGNIRINGDLSKQGNLIIGDSIVDTVIIGTDFTQSIIPGDNLLYNLGSPSRRWRDVYITDPTSAFFNVSQYVNISDQLAINGNTRTIFTLQSNEDLLIVPDSGITRIENLQIQDQYITNLDLSTPLVLSNTGIGYTRFVGSNGMVIPNGDTSTRQGYEIGATRWNTELLQMECFDGTIWIIATGPGATISESDMEELGHLYTLILG
jgi:hypothetical protein